MSEPLGLILIAAALMSAMMVLLWGVYRWTGQPGVVDVGWCGGLGVLAFFYCAVVNVPGHRPWIVAAMGAIWSARLTWHVWRRLRREREDGRYVTLEKNWGSNAPMRFFVFFQIQGLLDVLFSIPFLIVMLHPSPDLRLFDWLGIAVWIVAVGGEALADHQLSKFKANPAHRGKTCRAGLWRYSRHPNYFFEWLHWWAYVVMAVGAPYGWSTLLAPALMLYFLFSVTGIPPTEEQALKSRGEDYRRYQQETSVFFPWFPRKGVNS